MNEKNRDFKALFFGITTLYILLKVLKWDFFISAILALGTYFGVYFINKPKLMIGDADIEALANAEEIKNIYEKYKIDIENLKKLATSIEDRNLREKALELSKTSFDISAYLANNPLEISTSRHFLEYYMKVALEIVGNYNDLSKANVSYDKFSQIKEKTIESVDLLKEIFAKQRDSYHKDKINELEVESDLLEQTIKLGGDIKWKKKDSA